MISWKPNGIRIGWWQTKVFVSILLFWKRILFSSSKPNRISLLAREVDFWANNIWFFWYSLVNVFAVWEKQRSAPFVIQRNEIPVQFTLFFVRTSKFILRLGYSYFFSTISLKLSYSDLIFKGNFRVYLAFILILRLYP